MFGNLGAFVEGNMFLGLLGADIGVKLDQAGQRDLAAAGGGPFGPAGRPMGGYVSLPKDSPFRDAIAATIPGKKSGPPEDLVGTLLLLVYKAGEWITGQTISVDGGWVMRL